MTTWRSLLLFTVAFELKKQTPFVSEKGVFFPTFRSIAPYWLWSTIFNSLEKVRIFFQTVGTHASIPARGRRMLPVVIGHTIFITPRSRFDRLLSVGKNLNAKFHLTFYSDFCMISSFCSLTNLLFQHPTVERAFDSSFGFPSSNCYRQSTCSTVNCSSTLRPNRSECLLMRYLYYFRLIWMSFRKMNLKQEQKTNLRHCRYLHSYVRKSSINE